MSYDDRWARSQKYSFAVTNADASFAIPAGPKGKKGYIMDVGVAGISTSFAGGTTTPAAKIGTAADDDAYMVSREWAAQTAPAAVSLRAIYDENVPAQAASLAAILVERDIPADTVTIAKWVAATGGGAAGVASSFFVIISWDP